MSDRGIVLSDHARQRWRQRFGASCPRQALAAAVRRRELEGRGRERVYVHACGAAFVCNRGGSGDWVAVTVVNASWLRGRGGCPVRRQNAGVKSPGHSRPRRRGGAL